MPFEHGQVWSTWSVGSVKVTVDVKVKVKGKGKGKGKGKELDGPECALECTIKIFSHHLDSWIAQHLAPGKRSA